MPVVGTPVAQPPYAPAVTPYASRRLVFASPDHHGSDEPEQDDLEHVFRKLMTSELAGIECSADSKSAPFGLVLMSLL